MNRLDCTFSSLSENAMLIKMMNLSFPVFNQSVRDEINSITIAFVCNTYQKHAVWIDYHWLCMAVVLYCVRCVPSASYVSYMMTE